VVGAYAAVVLPRGAQAYGRRTGLARWVRANLVAVRAGGRRTGSRGRAGVGARVGARARAGARAGNSNSGSGL